MFEALGNRLQGVFDRLRGRGALSEADVERLRTAGVTERVIGAMRAAVPAAPESVGAAAPDPGIPRVRLGIANRDARIKAFAFDAARRELRFLPEAAAGARELRAGSSAALEIEPGLIAVRWDRDYQHYRIALQPGRPIDAVLEPGIANGSAAVRLTLLRDGRFYAATNLKVFYARLPMVPLQVVPAPYAVIVAPEPYPCRPQVRFSVGAVFVD